MNIAQKIKRSQVLLVSFLLVSTNIIAQQATEIDTKSITLPRYNDLPTITAALPSPMQGMMVYNKGTATNWFYNGSAWVNLAMAASTPTEAEGFGSWGCNNAALKAYQPVGNLDGQSDDYFGYSVAISGDYAIVGVYQDDEGGFSNNGSATIFKRNASTNSWEQQGSKLLNSSSSIGDYFGNSVAISGDYAIVGAYLDDEGGFTDNGSATIFKRNASTNIWEQQGSKLLNPSTASYDRFGRSVAISGDFAIVAADGDDEGGFTDNGSATIYKRNASTNSWEPQGSKLLNPSSANLDYFGSAVAISGDYAIVGASYDDEGGFTDNGSATIYKRNASTNIWEQQGSKLLNPSSANSDFFAISVAISGDYAIVGVYSDDEGGFTDNGSATIFKRNASTTIWESLGKLINPSSASYDYFGNSVAISGDYAIVGAFLDDEGGFTNNGSATIYRRYGNGWKVVQKATDPSTENSIQFGNSVSIDGTTGRFLIGERGFSNSNNMGLAIFGQVR